MTEEEKDSLEIGIRMQLQEGMRENGVERREN